MYLGDTPIDTPAPLAGLTATEVAEYGGGSWSRTNNVYHEGTDLQSAAEHAISTIPPILTKFNYTGCLATTLIQELTT